MELSTLAIMFATASNAYNLPPGLLSAVCFTESSHRVYIMHKDDGGSSSLGICEIKLDTAKLMGFRGTELALMEPKINISYAAKYLAYQLRRYDRDLVKSIASYNSGSFITDKFGRPKNEEYVKKVFHAWLEKR